MSDLAVSFTFSPNTTISSSQVNTDFSDIVTYINNRDDGTATWDNLNVTATVANPVTIKSSASTTEVAIDNTATDGDPMLSFKLSGTSIVRLYIDDSDSDKLVLDDGTTVRMAMSTAGDFGFGTVNPNSYNSAARKAVLASSAASIGMTIRSATNGTNIIGFTDAEGTTLQGLLQYNHNATAASETLDMRVGGSDLFQFDGAGRMGVGNQAMSSYNAAADNIVVVDASTAGMTLKSAANSSCTLGFTDAVGTTLQGLIQYAHNATAANETMTFRVASVDYWQIDGSGHITPLSTTGTQNIGSASQYINDLSYKTITDRGCLGWFDEGVEMQDGRKVPDTEALLEIKMHPTKKTIYGTEMMDYRTFPKVAYKKAAVNGVELERDGNDEPIGGQDGIEMTSMFSIMIGAIKELTNRVKGLEAR